MTDAAAPAAPDLPDPETLSVEERLAFVSRMQQRMMENPDSVSEAELKHSLLLLRLNRSASAAASGSKRSSSAPVKPIADNFF